MKNNVRNYFIFLICAICSFMCLSVGCKAAVDNWKLSVSDVTLNSGEEVVVEVLSFPGGALEWRSCDESICTVTSIIGANSARICALASGETTVYVKAEGQETKVDVKVRKVRLSTAVTTGKATVNMDEGQRRVDLGIYVENGSLEDVRFSTDNWLVAEADRNGVVTAYAPGSATITAMHRGGASIDIDIQVIGTQKEQKEYPKTVFSGGWDSGHVQGIAIDTEGEYMYYTFTETFVKTDLEGNIIGSVIGYDGHLGDCTFNRSDGRVYASLTLATDEYNWTDKYAAYIAIIDVDKITRIGMDCWEEGIMTTVNLKEFTADYFVDIDGDGTIANGASSPDHRYGVWGIDGLAFGTRFGESLKGGQYLTVAYAIGKNESRIDNDYQVFLQYDVSDWAQYEMPLQSYAPHQSGPDEPDGKYFLYTGNTNFGVQTMDYDRDRNMWVCIVYNYAKSANGPKKDFDANTTFLIDNSVKPYLVNLEGQAESQQGNLLSFVKGGLYNEKKDIYSWRFWMGNTGFISLGNGYYYVSHSGTTAEGLSTTTVTLYRYTGSTNLDANANDLFEIV